MEGYTKSLEIPAKHARHRGHAQSTAAEGKSQYLHPLCLIPMGEDHGDSQLNTNPQEDSKMPKGRQGRDSSTQPTNLTDVELWKRPHLPKPWCLFYKTGIEACISKGRGDVCCRLLHDLALRRPPSSLLLL